jgi:regulator of sigma E protease
MVLTIVLGLIGLGLVIFIHEAGHFAAARLAGIEVESFALGWGRKLVSYRGKTTEYRLNIFPIGGYCRMKGEEDFKTAIEQKLDRFPASEGSLFSVGPFKRFLTYLAGPVANMVFAVVLFTLIALIGFQYASYPNTIVLASDYPNIYGQDAHDSPADRAGLHTGDRILEVNGQTVDNFLEIQEALMPRAEKETSITFERDGETGEVSLIPELNEATGAGVIGISAWIEPVIDSIPEGSVLKGTELQPGDRILSYDGKEITHLLDLVSALYADEDRRSEIVIERDGELLEIRTALEISEQGEPMFNAAFASALFETPDYTIPEALAEGFRETFSQISLGIRSISLLFSGLDARQAMAGPVKITYLLGDTAAQGFAQGLRTGIVTLMQLLAFVSVALGFANLLPIPALDGGQMAVSVYEMISRKPLKPALYYRLQIIGFSILFTILIFTVFWDIRSFF